MCLHEHLEIPGSFSKQGQGNQTIDCKQTFLTEVYFTINKKLSQITQKIFHKIILKTQLKTS